MIPPLTLAKSEHTKAIAVKSDINEVIISFIDKTRKLIFELSHKYNTVTPYNAIVAN